MSHPSASPIIKAKWTARPLTTGRAPGSARHTGHVWVLGASPKESSQPQNIFVRVFSCTWISSPMTGSYSATVGHLPRGRLDRPGSARVKADRALERVGGVEQARLAERRPRELEANREP